MEPYFGQRIFPAAIPVATSDPVSPVGFHPLFSVLGGTPGTLPRMEEAEPTPAEATGPQVEVVQENGRVMKIVVTCKCCERIELECEY